MRTQTFPISSRNTGKLFTILQIKHGGRWSDSKVRISTGFQWHEHFRKYHQGKPNCKSYSPMRNSCTVWKTGEQISSRALMLSLALAPRQVRYAGKLRLPGLLKRSEVQQLHPENDMQQVLHSLAAAWQHCGQEPHLLGNSSQPLINTSATVWMIWSKLWQTFQE